MHRILVQSLNQEEADHFKSFIETRLPYEVHTVTDFAQAESQLTHKPIQLFIWNTLQFGNEELEIIKELRQRGYTYPILVTPTSLSKSAFNIAVEKYKTHLLERPFEYKALRGVVRKLMIQRTIKQQKFRRFKTNQLARVETFQTEVIIESSMFNLSMGGAYVEIDKKPDITIGDLVKLEIALADLDRSHKMSAKVVWTTRRGSFIGGYGLGLKFVREQEVYRNLMDRV